MRYEELISGAEKLIRRYFSENLKEYHYKSEDAKDEVQCAIEDFICDTKDFISGGKGNEQNNFNNGRKWKRKDHQYEKLTARRNILY